MIYQFILMILPCLMSHLASQVVGYVLAYVGEQVIDGHSITVLLHLVDFGVKPRGLARLIMLRKPNS